MTKTEFKTRPNETKPNGKVSTGKGTGDNSTKRNSKNDKDGTVLGKINNDTKKSTK